MAWRCFFTFVNYTNPAKKDTPASSNGVKGVITPMNVHDGSMDEKEQQLIFLVESCQRSIYKTCCFYLNDHALAEDAMQETFLKAYRRLDQFKNQSSAKTWLMRIAINTCKDILKSAWYRHTDHRTSFDALPEQGAWDQEADTLYQRICTLPFRERDIILLYYYQDMTLEEIGKVLRVTPSCVSRKLKRARSLLREILEKEGICHA